jgi:hypothetical protein
MLRFTHFIAEAQGLTGRKPGETFTDKDGKVLIFKKVEFFDNPEDAGDVSDATPVNKPLSNLTGLGVVEFKNESGDTVRFVKYIKPGTAAWDNKNPGYFEFKSKATAKEQSGLKPSDFLRKMEGLTFDDLLDQVGSAFGEESDLYIATKQAIESENKSNYPIQIPIGNLSETGITNYFAEILQPIALINGDYTGNALDGIKALANTDDISDFRINFPKGVTQGLYDSYLTSGDSQINISSKYGSASQSAKASVTNLYKIYKAYKDKDMFEEFEDAVEIARIITEVDAEQSPLELAVLLNKLNPAFKFSEKEKNIVMELREDPTITLTKNIITLRDSIKPGLGKTPPPFYHVLAGIAKSVASEINSNEDIQFSRFATLLLNGTIIQVYTKASKKNVSGVDVIEFSPFNTKWPDDAVTNVLIESGTRYKTDRVDGKFGYIVKSK